MAQLECMPYAEALYELAQGKSFEQDVEDDLKVILETMDENPDLVKVMMHPRIQEEEKIKILDEIFSSEINEMSLNFLKVLIENKRFDLLRDTAERYRNFYHEDEGIIEVIAKTAVPMTEAEIESLTQTLGAKLNATIKLINTVDSSILGGVALQFDDKQIDGTVKGKLNRIAGSIKAMTL